jgi:hypothetical protein
MRRRTLLLVVLAGGLAAAGGAAFGTGAATGHESPAHVVAQARSDLADIPAPSVLSRARDGAARDHDARRDVAAALGIAFAILLTGGWWLARERDARVRCSRRYASWRTRAPPVVPAIVHC